MALTDINSALGTTFAKQMVRAWNRTSVLLQEMTIVSGGGQGGGKQVGWDVQFSGATAATFAEGADVSSFDNDAEVPATIAWGQYQSKFKLTNKEMNAAFANMGNATELEKILEERLFDAICAITSKINKDIIVGDGDEGGNPTIVGLIEALDSSGTYATIDKGVKTEWAGIELGNSGTARPLTLDLLAAAEESEYKASGQSPEMLVTTPGVRRKYEGLFNSVQRIMSPNGSGGPIARMDGGSEDLFWRGRPVIRDKDVSTGILMGLRPSNLFLHVLPWAPVEMQPTVVRDLISSNGGDLQKNLGAFVNIYPLGRTGSAVKFVAEIYCQLRVPRTNEHFIVKDISET